MKHLSDPANLVRLLNANDRAAFEYLYDHYSGTLYAIIVRIVKDENLASDVLQETFVKIWKSIHRYDAGKGTLFTWMLNIGRNRAIDAYRTHARLSSHVEIGLSDCEDGLYSYAVLPLYEIHDLRQLVAQLHPDKKQLIELAYFQGLTYEEISQMLLLPLGTVKSRIRNALAQLRAQFRVPGYLIPCT